LKVARSEAKRLEALVGYLTLSAPYDGVVTTRNANTGDFVFPAAGDLPGALAPPRTSPAAPMPVYVIQRTDVVRVCVDVPEADARFTQQGTDVSVQIKQARDQWIAARVARTSWALNPKTRTLRAEVDLDNADGRLQAGMYAYGKIAVRSENVQALPRAAVFEGGDKTFCWMYENGRAVQTEIRTGVSDGTWIEVISRRLPGRADGLESWTPIDGSEQIILGDRSHLTGGGPVQKK
jgi:multidrug efflux pump subunit AcrA (membrane-fusion protein)